MKWEIIKKGATPQLPGLFIYYEWVGDNIKSIILDVDGQSIRIGKEQYGDGVTVAIPEQPKKVKRWALICKDEEFGTLEKLFPSIIEANSALQEARKRFECASMEEREVILDANES